MYFWTLARRVSLTAASFGMLLVLAVLHKGPINAQMRTLLLLVAGVPAAGLAAGMLLHRLGWPRLAAALMLATAVPGIPLMGLFVTFTLGVIAHPLVAMDFLRHGIAQSPGILLVPALLLFSGACLLAAGRKRAGIVALWLLGLFLLFLSGALGFAVMFRFAQ